MTTFSINQQIFLSKCRLAAESVDNKLKEILNLVESQHVNPLPLGEILKRAKEHHVVFWQSLPKLWQEIDRYIRHLKTTLQPFHIQVDHGAEVYYRQSIWSTFLNRISLQPELISGSGCQGVAILSLLVECTIDTVFSMIPYVESEPLDMSVNGGTGMGMGMNLNQHQDRGRDRYLEPHDEMGYESKRHVREDDRSSNYHYQPVPTPREPIMIRLGGKHESSKSRNRSKHEEEEEKDRNRNRNRERERDRESFYSSSDESTVSSDRDDEGDRRSRRSKRYE